MLLGDVIAKFEDEAFVNETLLSLNNLALAAQVVAAAANNNISPGEFAMQSIGQFVNAASDEEWLTLTGLMSRTGNPGQVFLQRVLSNALPDPQKYRSQ
jgi:hypothetical protein